MRPLFVSHLFKRCPCPGFPVVKAGDHGEEKPVAVDDISCEDKRSVTPFDAVVHGDFYQLVTANDHVVVLNVNSVTCLASAQLLRAAFARRSLRARAFGAEHT